MYQRNIEPRILESLSDTPVVYLNGARQTGKSTLVKKIASGIPTATYVTLDDPSMFASASHDPEAFIRSAGSTLIIDEAQRAPSLFLAIKRAVDDNRLPGRFLLTGSANVLMLPKIAEALAGRIEIITLWPLSQGEFGNTRESFIDMLFSRDERPVQSIPVSESTLESLIARGGFPEAASRTSPRRRDAWFSSYIATIMQREILDLARIEGLAHIPRVMSLAASRLGGLLNQSELSRSSGIPNTTLERYLSLLQTTFQIVLLPAWSTNLGKRLVKAPKVYLCDSGLAASINGFSADRLLPHPTMFGALLENFVFLELIKQRSWSEHAVSLYHYRTSDGHEVDFILEDRAGRFVALEVKSSSTVTAADFTAMKRLSDALGDRFIRGCVLYCGNASVPFGDGFEAVPVQAMWG